MIILIVFQICYEIETHKQRDQYSQKNKIREQNKLTYMMFNNKMEV